MKWRKATEFKYIPLKNYYAQWTLAKPFKGSGYFDNIGIFRWDDRGYIPIQNADREREHLLILDETEQSSPDAKPLIEALEKIRDNFEHEDFGDKHQSCAVCIATEALKNYKP